MGVFLRFFNSLLFFFFLTFFLVLFSLCSSQPCYSFIYVYTPENRTSESRVFRFVENNAIKAEYIALVKLLICISGAPGLSIGLICIWGAPRLSIGQETKYAKCLCGFLRSVQSNAIILVQFTPNSYFHIAKSAFSVI